LGNLSFIDFGRSYRAFHRFGQAIFHDVGLVLGSSQFLMLPAAPDASKKNYSIQK